MPRTSQSIAKPKMTRAEEVRQRLAEEIAAGQLPPGTRLDEIEQSQRLGVSRTPLREALRQLAAMGMVKGIAHRGVMVAEGISPQMVDALSELEALCACRAGRRMIGPDRRELRRIAAERGGWLAMIHAAVGNPMLVRFAESLWQPLMGVHGPARFDTDELHPLGLRLADAVAEGELVAIDAAARHYVGGCAALVLPPRR